MVSESCYTIVAGTLSATYTDTVTEKQRADMAEAGVDFTYRTVYDLTCGCLIRLLDGGADGSDFQERSTNL